jgi:phosphoribosylanthranilate isomerase
MLVKICGITRLTEARHAVACGVDALGFVFWPKSPRYIAPERAVEIIATLPARVTTVGVFVNESVAGIRAIVEGTGIGVVQLHGDETPDYASALGRPVWRAFTVERAEAMSSAWPPETTVLVDASDPVRRGGTGVKVDWRRAAGIARAHRIVLAGGLTPENVVEAIETVRPYGVDVSSGVEDSPGVKNVDKIERFLTGARSAFGKQ